MAIDPKLVSIKKAGDLPSGIPTATGEFLYWEDETLMKAEMSDLYDRLESAYLGIITPSSTIPATGSWYGTVLAAGTFNNVTPAITVDAADFDVENGTANNEVRIIISEGVASKDIRRVKADAADPAKLPLYSAIKGSNIAAGTQFIDDENGNIVYRVKTGQTLLTTETPAATVGVKTDILARNSADFFTLRNTLVNADFASTANWGATLAPTLAVETGGILAATLQATTVGSNWRVEQTIDNAVIGRKYYLSVEFLPLQSNVSSVQYGAVSTGSMYPVVSQWNKIKGIVTATANTRFRIYHNTANYSVSDVVRFRRPQVFDLTAIYGAGNEPTITDFEKTLDIIESDFIATNRVITTKDVIDYMLKSTEGQTVTVKTSGGDYTSIQAAINAVSATQERPANIMIYPGTYTEEITGKHWVNLIGISREDCIIQSLAATGNEVNRDTIKAPYNMRIANLTIKGTNVKYCIHDDASTGEHTLHIINCVLEKTTAATFDTAIGLGLRAGQHVVVENSNVKGQGIGIFYHNWNAQTGFGSLTVENSRVEGTTRNGINVQSLGSNMTDLIILKGNKITGGQHDVIVGRNTAYGFNQDDFVFIASGNQIATFARTTGSTITFEQPIPAATTVVDVP